MQKTITHHQRQTIEIFWRPPDENWICLNSNEVVQFEGEIWCGGFVRDGNGAWLGGF